jgi:hypothetical protein
VIAAWPLDTDPHACSCHSQCHGLRQPRRSDGRRQAGQRAHQKGRGDTTRPRLDRDHDRAALRAGVATRPVCPPRTAGWRPPRSAPRG